MAQAIIKFFSFFPHWLEVLVVSLIPVVELRGAIPLGTLAFHMPYWQVFLLAWLGNMIPAPFILKFIPSVLEWMRGTKIFGPFANWLHKKGMKSSEKIRRYKFWGLTVFIAIPLPGTGVWTGCLAASLIEMDFKQGMISAALGSAIAGVIVTVLCAAGLMVANI